jgi:hypothetical protein
MAFNRLSGLFQRSNRSQKQEPSQEQVSLLAAQSQHQSEIADSKEHHDFHAKAMEILNAQSSELLPDISMTDAYLLATPSISFSSAGSNSNQQTDIFEDEISDAQQAWLDTFEWDMEPAITILKETQPQTIHLESKLIASDPVETSVAAKKLHAELSEKYKIWYQAQFPDVATVETLLQVYPLFKEATASIKVIEQKLFPHLERISGAIHDSKIQFWEMRETITAKQYENYKLSIDGTGISHWRLSSHVKGDPEFLGNYIGTEIFTRLTQMANDDLLPAIMRQPIEILLQNFPIQAWIDYQTLIATKHKHNITLWNIHGASVEECYALADNALIEAILIPDSSKLPEDHIIHKINKIHLDDYRPSDLTGLLILINDLQPYLKINTEKLFDLMSLIIITPPENNLGDKIHFQIDGHSKFMYLLLSLMKDFIANTDSLARSEKRRSRIGIASVIFDRGYKMLPFSCDELEHMKADKFFQIIAKQVVTSCKKDTYNRRGYSEFIFSAERKEQIDALLLKLDKNKDALSKRREEIKSTLKHEISTDDPAIVMEYKFRTSNINLPHNLFKLYGNETPKGTAINLTGKQVHTESARQILVKKEGTVAEHFGYSIYLVEKMLGMDCSVKQAADAFLWCMNKCMQTSLMVENKRAIPILCAQTKKELCTAMKGYTLNLSDFTTPADEFIFDDVTPLIPKSPAAPLRLAQSVTVMSHSIFNQPSAVEKKKKHTQSIEPANSGVTLLSHSTSPR